MRAILIDHEDSFTHNLRHWLKPLFSAVDVLPHLHLTQVSVLELIGSSTNPPLLVLSPGPKSPDDYPDSIKLLHEVPATIPVLGICLGLQLMTKACHGRVHPYTPPRHGKTSRLDIIHSVYQTLQSRQQSLIIARYHSLRIQEPAPQDLLVIARAQDDNCPMWVQHRFRKWMGLQFHPESFLTENPDFYRQALKFWLDCQEPERLEQIREQVPTS